MTLKADRRDAGFAVRGIGDAKAAVSAGSTISGHINKTVTVGSAGYLSPLTITSTGVVDPAPPPGSIYTGYAGLVLAQPSLVGTIINAGFISGRYVGSGDIGGVGDGGVGVELYSAFVFSNSGLIEGGAGAFAAHHGYGGDGVLIAGFGTFTNTGRVFGGNGGPNSYGRGGDGISFSGAGALINSGSIAGGSAESNGLYGAPGGYGVSAAYADSIKNTGVIVGGAGGQYYGNGAHGRYGGNGTGGVFVNYGTLNNGGTILGGAGGNVVAQGLPRGGGGGYGVFLYNNATGTNSGSILGGAGAYGEGSGGYGGNGFRLDGYSSLINSGKITGGNGGNGDGGVGGGGGTGLLLLGHSTASNSGAITGGTGGTKDNDSGFGGAGGDGVIVHYASFMNAGKVTGGTAGNSPGSLNSTTDIAGGIGLYAIAGVINNSGTITGGNGSSYFVQGGTTGSGGDGVFLKNASSFTNTGTIIGGTGGHKPFQSYIATGAGSGGAGVVISAGSTLINSKLIKGGTGGYYSVNVGQGGDGVDIAGGTFINSGTVTQGYGGVNGGSKGPNGYAVLFTGGGTLVAAPGAKFIGSVACAPGEGGVLELTGTSSTAFTGIGTQFTGLTTISFAAGAVRTLEGSFQSGAIAGFAAHDALVLDGFSATVNATSLFSKSIEFVGAKGAVAFVGFTNLNGEDLEVSAGGGKTTLTALAATATTLASGTAEFTTRGATASGLISKGATETILIGGSVTATTIAGGTLTLDAGAKASGTIAFSGTGGLLQIDSTKVPGAIISGFTAGDTIKLSGVTYNAADRVTVGTAGIVTVAVPGLTLQLNIKGATVGETDFKFSAGSLLTKMAAVKPAMRFVAPAPVAGGEAQGWTTDVSNPFAVLSFPESPTACQQGLTLFAQFEPGLSYGFGHDNLQDPEPASGAPSALLRHTGSWF